MSSFPHFFALLLILAQGLPWCPVYAQQPAAPSKLASVKILGSNRYSETQIAAASGLKLGDPVGKDDLQAAADRLSQLGPFVNVHYKFSSHGENVSVTYELEDAPAVPVAFDNFPWFSNDEIMAALQAAVALYRPEVPAQGALLDDISGVLNTLLASRGIKGVIEHSLVGRPGAEGLMVQFRVNGPSLKVSAVQLGHALAAEDKRLASLSRELVGKPYSQFVAELFAFEQIRPVYFEKGFLRARFGVPEARFTGDPRKSLPDEVTLIFPIEPGSPYKWTGATWSGNTVYSSAALDVMTRFSTDEPANGVKITGLWERLRSEYARRGYLDAAIDPMPSFDDAAGRVTYNVNIREGIQYKMGELVLTGLSVAAERKVKEAWRIAHGDVFDRVYFDEFYSSGIKKLFEDTPVHFSEVGQWLRTNPETKTVDVLLDFK